jgi:hypothetical protein
MKKFFSIICCAMVLLAVSSCTKQYVNAGSPNETVTATILPSAWTLYTDGKSYMAPINVPQIGPGFAQSGGLIVGISYSTQVYEQIPEVYNGTSFSYTYNPGNVTLYAQSPDGTTAVKPTDTLRVKITLVSTN